MVLRAVAVGVVSLVLFGCARTTPIAVPTVVVIAGVGGERVDVSSETPDDGGTWNPSDEVEVAWHGTWWPALVLARRGGRWLVHYEGYTSDWDEVVTTDRIRERHVEPEMSGSSEAADDADP